MVRDASFSKVRTSHFEAYIVSISFQRLLTTGIKSPLGGFLSAG